MTAPSKVSKSKILLMYTIASRRPYWIKLKNFLTCINTHYGAILVPYIIDFSSTALCTMAVHMDAPSQM